MEVQTTHQFNPDIALKPDPAAPLPRPPPSALTIGADATALSFDSHFFRMPPLDYLVAKVSVPPHPSAGLNCTVAPLPSAGRSCIVALLPSAGRSCIVALSLRLGGVVL